MNEFYEVGVELLRYLMLMKDQSLISVRSGPISHADERTESDSAYFAQ